MFTKDAAVTSNSRTILGYEIPSPSHVRMRVFDAQGHLIATLVDEERSAGLYEATFDTSRLASGLYFCRFEAWDSRTTLKLARVR